MVDAIWSDVVVARSAADAPEIDGVMRIANAASLRVGEFAGVTITAANPHDLIARLAR
jgi:ribosomal protein S12 methylthiotransferase